MPKQVTRMEVDDSVVEIRPIEREVQWHHIEGAPHYRQKSLYEVYVDDVHRGWLSFPLGWGGAWTLHSLRPQNERYDPAYHKHDDEEKTRYGRQGYYKALLPGSLNETENWGVHRKRWDDRNDILAHLPKLIALGRLPTAEEVETQIVQWRADYDERQRADAARAEQHARERAERKRRDEEAALRAEEARVETLEGLHSLRARFSQEMSNLELLALGRAIDHVTIYEDPTT